MLRLNILELLEKKGKTKYWLYKQLGMSYQNFNKMLNNQTKSIKFDNLESICLILECEINDVFVFENIKKDKDVTDIDCNEKDKVATDEDNKVNDK